MSVCKWAKSTYEGVVTTSYKETTWAEANRTGLSRNKRREYAFSNNHPTKDGSTGKRRKWYLDRSKSASKTCIIHGSGQSYGEFKVLGEFETKYAAAYPGKDRGSNPIPSKRFQKKQDNHTIINNVVDELHMIESKKVNAVNHEALEFL